MRRVIAGTALLLAAGCSGSSGGSTPAPSPVPSESPAATPTDVTPSPSESTVPSASASPTVAALPRCVTAQLRLSVVAGDSGAGQFHQRLVLTNTGAQCTLLGYPGVSFVDAHGAQLGSPATATTAPVRRQTLAPGGTAAALLTYSNAQAFPDSSCRPQESDRVKVYPPGDRAALLARDPILVCSAPGSGQLHIGPVDAG